MAGRLSPYRFPLAWGRMIIGGIYVPGIIESIDGCEKPQRWVFQMGLTVSNSVSIWRGQKLAESIKIVTRLPDDQSFQDADRFMDIMLPTPGRKPPSLMCINAAFNWVGINRVSLVNFVAPKPAGGLSWTYGIEVCEFNPMKQVPVGPADPPKGETENDRLQKEFSGLMGRAAKLGFP
jgi:hypothetical protein